MQCGYLAELLEIIGQRRLDCSMGKSERGEAAAFQLGLRK
jgi:hypothetical protein